MILDRTADLEMPVLFEKVKNWHRWGEDDQRGTLNLLTDDKVVQALSLVHRGRSISCASDLRFAPSVDNPTPAQHMMLLAGDSAGATGVRGLETATDFVGIAFHGMVVTHLDALCHVFVNGQMYNGRSAAEVTTLGAAANSVAAAFDGLVGRGVLLDIPRVRRVDWIEPEDPITLDELDAAESNAGALVGPGDIVIISTGRDKRRAAKGPWDPVTEGLAGLHPECVRWIHDKDIAVLGSDGISDPLPANDCDWPIPIHQCCLVAMGVHLLDNLRLDALVSACAEEGRWEFLFVASPLRIQSGTGSPLNPIAVL